MSLNRVIGKENDLPWHVPEDFKWFKSQTKGHVCVMGRKTFESMPGLLPGRQTIILTRAEYKAEGAEVIHDWKDLLNLETDKDIWICGGAEIYKLLLPHCSDLYLTIIKKEVEGDTCFPAFEDLFQPPETIRREEEFDIQHYKRKG